MKKIIIQISVFCMVTMCASESDSIKGAEILRQSFLGEIVAHYTRMEKGLKTFEPKGSERRHREDDCIVKTQQCNENVMYYIETLSIQDIWRMFQEACLKQVSPVKHVVIYPTKEDVVVFDSLQLPQSFAYYLKIVSREQ